MLKYILQKLKGLPDFLKADSFFPIFLMLLCLMQEGSLSMKKVSI